MKVFLRELTFSEWKEDYNGVVELDDGSLPRVGMGENFEVLVNGNSDDAGMTVVQVTMADGAVWARELDFVRTALVVANGLIESGADEDVLEELKFVRIA